MSGIATKIRYLDLSITDAEERRELLDAAEAVFKHGRLVLGPEVQELEARIAARAGRRFAVGVNSGTDALILSVKALGIGPGDEVITPALSWIATANAVRLAGGTPVFADIRDDLNVDPESVARLITPRTKALLPVHYTGKVCAMPELLALAKKRGLPVIEDSAQAFDASLEGRKAGAFGTLGCFSMNPMKVYAAIGEAGMVLTDSEDLRDRLVSLRYHGTINREKCVELSWNGRLDTLQAAFLLKRLDRLDRVLAKRREVARWYDELLKGLVDLPLQQAGERDVFYCYMVRANRRDELKACLEAAGIETKIHHPILVPEQPIYGGAARGEWRNAARLRDRILSLPIHEKLDRAQVEYVADRVREFYRCKAPPRR